MKEGVWRTSSKVKNLTKNLYIENQDLGQDLIEMLIEILNEKKILIENLSENLNEVLPKILIFDEVFDEDLDSQWDSWWGSWLSMRYLMRFLILNDVLAQDLIEILILEQSHSDSQWEKQFFFRKGNNYFRWPVTTTQCYEPTPDLEMFNLISAAGCVIVSLSNVLSSTKRIH